MDKQNKLWNFVENSQALLNNLHSANFIKNLDSLFITCNQATEDMLRVKAKNVVERSDYDFPWENNADLYRQHDQDALKTGFSDVLEPVRVSNKTILVLRSIKYPIKDERNEAIGIFAQMTILSKNKSLEDASAFINIFDQKRTNTHKPSPKAYHIDDYHPRFKFTSRETECLFLLIRGKSAKEIAKFLGLSHRTVEVYIENIKIKLNVFSKSGILDKALELGLFEIIPKKEIFLNIGTNSNKWKEFLS